MSLGAIYPARQRNIDGFSSLEERFLIAGRATLLRRGGFVFDSPEDFPMIEAARNAPGMCSIKKIM